MGGRQLYKVFSDACKQVLLPAARGLCSGMGVLVQLHSEGIQGFFMCYMIKDEDKSKSYLYLEKFPDSNGITWQSDWRTMWKHIQRWWQQNRGTARTSQGHRV